jgi:hypothetical protein
MKFTFNSEVKQHIFGLLLSRGGAAVVGHATLRLAGIGVTLHDKHLPPPLRLKVKIRTQQGTIKHTRKGPVLWSCMVRKDAVVLCMR